METDAFEVWDTSHPFSLCPSTAVQARVFLRKCLKMNTDFPRKPSNRRSRINQG
jgi:hypothetical protein